MEDENIVIEEIEKEVKFGFHTEAELVDVIMDMFNEEAPDGQWVEAAISKRYRKHQDDSRSWQRPTDFEKLAAAFDELTQGKIVSLHNAGYTKQDAEYDCREAIDNLKNIGVETIGYCYYHTQDLERAIDTDIRNLYIGYDSATGNDGECLSVAKKITSTLTKHGLTISWDGSLDQRIEIKNIEWRKVPDSEDWSAGRVIKLLAPVKTAHKPFWKFW